jgi:conjugative transfer pilus assembly protein TraH
MKEQAGMPNNYTWEALGKKYGGFDTQFREFLMTLVGTVIYDPQWHRRQTARPVHRPGR